MPDRETTAPQGVVVDGGTDVGVLVLAGSSGRVEADRCRLLAAQGMTAASIRYFGGADQPAHLDRVPLETFEPVLAQLHERCERLAVLGTSKGAEAALLLTASYPEVDAVVAVAPSHVVWAALSDERPQRSSWTRGGEPLPFVPYDDRALRRAYEAAADGPVAYVDAYLESLETYADRVPAARIPVERVAADVVLVAGGDDRLWPGPVSARLIEAHRAAAGLATTVITRPDAGHRVVLPGETPPPAPTRLAHGGSPAADTSLGALAWPEVLRVLRGAQ